MKFGVFVSSGVVVFSLPFLSGTLSWAIAFTLFRMEVLFVDRVCRMYRANTEGYKPTDRWKQEGVLGGVNSDGRDSERVLSTRRRARKGFPDASERRLFRGPGGYFQQTPGPHKTTRLHLRLRDGLWWTEDVQPCNFERFLLLSPYHVRDEDVRKGYQDDRHRRAGKQDVALLRVPNSDVKRR